MLGQLKSTVLIASFKWSASSVEASSASLPAGFPASMSKAGGDLPNAGRFLAWSD